MAEYVTVIELAREFGVSKTSARNWILSNGFTPMLIHTPHSRGQEVHALTLEDAEAARMLRRQQGYSGEIIQTENGDGWFYIIHVVPDLEPKRLKFGWASDVKSRLASHRCVSPTAQIARTWNCKRTWEAAAIAAISRKNCRSVGNEVFHADSVEQIIQQGEEFFAMMPPAV